MILALVLGIPSAWAVINLFASMFWAMHQKPLADPTWRCFVCTFWYAQEVRSRRNGSNRKSKANYPDSEAGGDASEMGRPERVTSAGSVYTPTAAASSGLEVVQQAEPIRAWRGVGVGASHYTVWLTATNPQHGILNVNEHKAICQADTSMRMYMSRCSEPHGVAPHLTCQCGFYGVIDKAHSYGHFIAEVDFCGKVIEHDLGYRAEYQRILSLRVKREVCMAGFLCARTPEVIVFPSDTHIKPMPSCQECATKHERVATLGQIAGRLGIEVRWDDG